MVTRAPRLKELAIADIDTNIRKALKMKDARNKYQMLVECVKMMKIFLKIEEVTVIL